MKLYIGVNNGEDGGENDGNNGEQEREMGEKTADHGDGSTYHKKFSADFMGFVPDFIAAHGPGGADANEPVAGCFFAEQTQIHDEYANGYGKKYVWADEDAQIPEDDLEVDAEEKKEQEGDEAVVPGFEGLDIFFEGVEVGEGEENEGQEKHDSGHKVEAHGFFHGAVGFAQQIPVAGEFGRKLGREVEAEAESRKNGQDDEGFDKGLHGGWTF